MALAPFRVSLTLVISDGHFDLPQNLFAGLADRRTQGGDGGRGIEVKDVGEVLRGKVALRLQAAAGQQGVGGADDGGVSEGRPDVEIIIIFQVRTVNDAKDVKLVVLPVFVHQLGGDPLQLFFHAAGGIHVEAAFQGGGHGVVMLVPVFPKIGAAGFLPAARVGHVEYIPKPGTVAAGVDQGDPPAPAPHIAVHGVVPKLVVRAGRGLRPLGVDHQLLVIGVLIQSCGGGEKTRPRLQAAGDLLCGLVGQLRVELQFAWHI